MAKKTDYIETFTTSCTIDGKEGEIDFLLSGGNISFYEPEGSNPAGRLIVMNKQEFLTKLVETERKAKSKRN